MSFVRESLRTFGTRILLVLANIPLSILIFRHLGAAGQGIYSSATTYATTTAVIGLLGIDAAHTYYLASGRYRSGQVIGNSLGVIAVLSLVLMPLLPPLLRYAAEGEGHAFLPYIALAALLVPVILARYLLLSIFMARRRVDAFNVLFLGSNVLLLGTLAVGFYGFGGGERLALWAFFITQIAMVLAGALWVWRTELRGQGRLGFSRALLGDSLHYGLRGFLATLLTSFIYRFDTVLVLRWLGSAAQGYYFIAVALAEKLTHITASVQAVLFPHISGASEWEANRLTPRVCRHTLLWVLLAAGLLALVATPLMRLLYGDDIEASIAPMRILLPGIAALTISKLLTSDLSGRNRRFFPTLIMAFALALNLGLNVLWTPRHGIVGAAWASTVAYGVQALSVLLYFWGVTGVAPGRILLPDREDWMAYKRLIPRRSRQT